MVFNWFRRQFSEKSEQQEDDRTEAAEEKPTAESASTTSVEDGSSTAIAEDYLSWAKAAYKNIQQHQETQAPTAVEPALTSPAVEAESEQPAPTVSAVAVVEELAAEPAIATEPSPEIEAAQTAELPAEEADAELAPPVPEVADAGEAVEPVVGETPEREPPADIHTPVLQVAVEATEDPELPTEEATAMPFWARAQAEREARLERLSASAIEVPEAEGRTQDAETEEIPGLAFDEGFVWSAEILAAQGRRPDQISIEEITWLKKLRQGLDKTRRSLINQLRAIVGQGPLNRDAVMEIEAALLQADVGVEATDYIIEALQKKLRVEALPPAEAIAYLKQILRDMLDNPTGKSYNPTFAPEKDTLNIWLIVGVNGAGKTTTIGKIAHIAEKSGYRCLIAAADTFRAAAVEQVKIWGQRSGVEVIANPGQNTDPAAVVFDAIAAAQSRSTELLIVDTAGRLQNKKNLMDELSKVRRIIDKKAPDAVVESLLVLDATLGQNGLRQAEVFSEAVKLNGVVLTKLDGTGKGGIALAVVKQLGLPIRFIGAGEGIEDLRPFSSYEFVEALLNG